MTNRTRNEPDYNGSLAHSKRIQWALDDVLPEDHDFDFGRRFMPEPMVGANTLDFLGADAKLALNQIRGGGYLASFGLVEAAIVPYVLDHIEAHAATATADENAALANFANEELKHIRLFERFAAAFRRGPLPQLASSGTVDQIQAHVLSHPALSIGMYILHIEWMTQRHYLAMAQRDPDLEPSFKRLLHAHWLEESQHARLDGWMILGLAERSTAAEREAGIEGYFALVSWLAGGLDGQAEQDLSTLEQLGLRPTDEERETFLDEQRRILRDAYVITGLSHPRVREVLEEVHAPSKAIIDQHISRWS